MSRKVYVRILAEFDIEGKVLPLSFKWEDERVYEIDRINDICRAASLKAGGCGLRYSCMVRGRQVYLFLEEGNKWFIEGR